MDFMFSFSICNESNKNKNKKWNITKWHVIKWNIKLKISILIYKKLEYN
jgi:hypothetical protein